MEHPFPCEGENAEAEFVACTDSSPSLLSDDAQDYGAVLLSQSIWRDEDTALTRVSRLLEMGTSANAIVDDSSRRSALHVAAIRDWPKMCELLLEHGANANLKDTRGWTARKAAFYHGCQAASDSLRANTTIGTEADYTIGEESSTDSTTLSGRLRKGAIDGDVECLKAALQEVAETAGTVDDSAKDVDFIDSRNVLDCGDGAQRSPLCYAAALGQHEAVRMLLAAGANPNVWIKSDHITPLGLASCRGHHDVVDILIRSEGVRSSDRNSCYLHAIYRKDSALLRCLLSREPNPKGQNMIELALFQACTVGFLEGVIELIAHGINFNSSSWMVQGETPIMRAVAMDHSDLVSYLMKENAIVAGTYDPFGERHNILHRAVLGGNVLTLRRLLVLCPPLLINEGDQHGSTPLHFACCYNLGNAVRALLEAGANRFLQRLDRKLASELARSRGHVKCAEYVDKYFPSLVHICIASLNLWCSAPLQEIVASLSLPEAVKGLVRWRYSVPWLKEKAGQCGSIGAAGLATKAPLQSRKLSLAGYV